MSATLTPAARRHRPSFGRPPASPQSEQAASRFRPDIEGMRGIAVLLVVLFHAGVAQLPGGFVGVDVFFVISGFLITRLLVDELARNGRISLRAFYLRRTRRLLPALALVTTATVLLGSMVLSPLDAVRAGHDGIWSSLYLANVHFLDAKLDYFAPAGYESPLLHIWSLAVEEQFYVVWPVVLILAAAALHPRARNAFGLLLVLATAASFAGSVALTASNPTAAYFSPLTRAWELGLGGIVAIWWAQPPRSLGPVLRSVLGLAGVAGIVVGATMLSEQTPFPGVVALVPVGGAALVLLAAPGTVVGRALSLDPLQRVGTISYSLYLWHWPVLVLGPYLLGGRSGAGVSALLVAVSVLLAWVTYRWIENPIRNDASLRRSPRRGLVLAVVCMALPIAASVGVVAASPIAGGPPAAAPAPLRDVDQAAGAVRQALQGREVPGNLSPSLLDAGDDLAEIYRNGCDSSDPLGAEFRARCVFGVRGSSHRVVLFGDSHAGHWFEAMRQLAERNGWELVSLTRNSCPPMRMPVFRRYDGMPDTRCEKWQPDAVDRIELEQPDVVLASGSWEPCRMRPRQCITGMSRFAAQMRRRVPDATVLVLQDTPASRADVASCLARHLQDAGACAVRTGQVMVDGDVARQLRDAASRHGAGIIRADEWVCVDGRCPAVVGNLLAYRVDHHLTSPFSLWLAPLLEDELVRRTSLPRT